MNKRGITLIELLLAAVIAGVSILALATQMPKVFRNMVESKRRWEATNLANTLMQDTKATVYPLISLTNKSAANFTDIVSDPGGCDCSTALWGSSGLNATPATVTINRTVYRRQICVNRVERVGGAWQSRCPDSTAADSGTKLIRVRVTWTGQGGQTNAIELESSAMR